ncbi:MAG TPA: deoxynucleoside kinase, partial [Rectinema sp.]|nr:deoxynucleoside kinase [Rectinema sp.]
KIDMHIGVAGNIGSGKTTLTELLSKHYGWTPQYESVTFNPYLEDYYKDIPRWSYNLETYFLAQRFKDLLAISKSKETIIQDRTLMEGVHIFVENNREMGNLSERDYQTYMQLYSIMMSMVKPPELLIYLRSGIEHLVSNIQKRGRDYEQGMSIEYLSGLNRHYEEWISSYKGKLLIIETDNLDFKNNPEDFALITDKIDAELFGLFK